MRLPAAFVWGYGSKCPSRARLYEESKASRWDAAADLDWALDVDPGAPGVDGSLSGAWLAGDALGGPLIEALGDDPEVLREIVAQHHGWLVSQILHGEQGALVVAAEVCAAAESIDDKLTTAALVADEARHVEAYQRYLDKIGISYPVSPPLHDLLSQAVNHRHADLAYLGTQILVEGVAGAASQVGGALFANPLIRQLTALVRLDEDRHIAYGLLSLQGLYEEMTGSERREREDFVIESCRLLSDQFQPTQVWEHFGIDTDAAASRFADSGDAWLFRSLVFSEVVPNLHTLGLLTSRVRTALEAMGLLALETYVESPLDPPYASPVDLPAIAPFPPLERLVSVGDEDPFLALRAVLGTVELIAPEPVLCVLAALVDADALATVPPARVRLQVAGFEDGDWLVSVHGAKLSYRRAGVHGSREADVLVLMDATMWSDLVAGRIDVPAALSDERVTVTGSRAKAHALEALF